ncbi:MAG: hypothetical protein ABSD78_14445 [Acidimicrobiales bacterium]
MTRSPAMVLGLVAGLTRRFGRWTNRSRRTRWAAVAAVLCAAAADAAVASTSRPFTWPADITTALGLVGVVLAGLTRLWVARQATAPVPPPVPPGDVPASGGAGGLLHPDRRTIVLWITVTLAVVAFELFNYASSPRSTHPTLSSILNVLTGHEVLRGLLFATWLGAGWWIWGRS